MPRRLISDELWGDPWIRKRSPIAKLVFVYLFSNQHCSPAGIYVLDAEHGAQELGITKEQFKQALGELEPKVAYFQQRSVVWVKTFLRYQLASGAFARAVVKWLDGRFQYKDLAMKVEAHARDVLGIDLRAAAQNYGGRPAGSPQPRDTSGDEDQIGDAFTRRHGPEVRRG